MALAQSQPVATGTRWQIKGTMVQACNCAWGCPCEFNSLPTEGHCHGTWSWHIESGRFGATDLSGIHFAAACKWPGAIHEGNGECLPILDARASEDQVQAIAALLSGRAGGPWEIIGATLTKIHEPRLVDWTVEGTGSQARYRAGDVFDLELTPMTNPITGDPFEAIVSLPSGFTSKQLAHASSRTFRVGGPVAYEYPGRDAAYGPFAYEGLLPG